jgi:glucokinase
MKNKIKFPMTVSPSDLQAINRTAVLEYLRLAKQASQTAIANQLNLSESLVIGIIDQLVESGFVVPVEQADDTNRPAQNLFTINENINIVVGIDIGGGHISGAAINLGGHILYESSSTVEWSTAEANLDLLLGTIQSILSQMKNQNARLLGITIGVPGIVDQHNGVVKFAPGLAWHEYPLMKKLEQIFDLPITIENDVNLAIQGEHWFGAGRGLRDLVMIAIGTGIGSGIILDGRLHRGFQGTSGEIGYFLPGIEFLDQQYPGFGALELLASGRGIAERGGEKFAEQNPGFPPPVMDAEIVFQAARDGEPWATQTVADTVDYYSLMIANITLCLDPELIILGGGVSGAADLLIEPIRERLTGVIPSVPYIKKSHLMDKATLLGAVVSTFQRVTNYAAVYHS